MNAETDVYERGRKNYLEKNYNVDQITTEN